MRRAALVLVALALLAGAAARADAAAARPPVRRETPPPAAPPAPAPPHAGGELECRNCHQGQHGGIVRMYVGLGGRGTPQIPSHMFQVRVECVACHVAPRADAGAADLAGRTFTPSEQACVGCHGEKFRGMLARWVDTLARMRAIVEPKLTAAQAALGAATTKDAKTMARARRLVGDAEFNVRFVALAKGVHNVFYAADLLKLSNGWLDDAFGALGQAPPKGDTALVRGGYCAVLCHEPAGVKARETVRFRGQTLPHVRHVAEFGAVCTACHSAERHKAVTATPSTCRACHHSPANERCESCHRAQSAFYRGQVTTADATFEPNAMAEAVGCTGCHDFTRRHSRPAVAQKCLGCHDASYGDFLRDWTTGMDASLAAATAAVKRAELALARERRAGRPHPEAAALAKQARDDIALVRKARGVHNPAGADALLEAARTRAEQALALVGAASPSPPSPTRGK